MSSHLTLKKMNDVAAVMSQLAADFTTLAESSRIDDHRARVWGMGWFMFWLFMFAAAFVYMSLQRDDINDLRRDVRRLKDRSDK